MTFRTLCFSLVSIATLAFVSPARAQSFPADDRWAPLPCGAGPMVDGRRDQSGAFDERDIVGDDLAPAGFHAADATFAYLRVRLDQDPAPKNVPRPFSWGFAIDLDGNRATYELLVIVDGTAKQVAVHRNTTTTIANSPDDPADDPPVATFPFATHARSVATSSRYGGDPDYFLDVAVPWSTLEPLGLTRTKPLVVWAATSSKATSLDGDLACHDGASGAPQLSGVAPPPTTLDPVVDTDGDGWSDANEVAAGTDPNNPASHPSGTPPALGSSPVLEGAGGCAIGHTSSASLGFATMLVAFAWLVRRSRVTDTSGSRRCPTCRRRCSCSNSIPCS
ncbi:MAG: thrombospondin type 3 repeat-containing protein [Polyangiales bacterium]